ALAHALAAQQGDAPVFIGIKMHDNDFFAMQSAWVTVYVQGRKRPPWDVSQKAPLLSPAEQAARWTLYEQTVRYVASQRQRLTPVNLPQILAMVGRPQYAR
ncbi:MAG: hypothetical protein D6775_12265, partial [Caldilineae bacterium]